MPPNDSRCMARATDPQDTVDVCAARKHGGRAVHPMVRHHAMQRGRPPTVFCIHRSAERNELRRGVLRVSCQSCDVKRCRATVSRVVHLRWQRDRGESDIHTNRETATLADETHRDAVQGEFGDCFTIAPQRRVVHRPSAVLQHGWEPRRRWSVVRAGLLRRGHRRRRWDVLLLAGWWLGARNAADRCRSRSECAPCAPVVTPDHVIYEIITIACA